MASNDALGVWSHSEALDRRRQTLVMVRWALVLTCGYLILLSKGTALPAAVGLLLVAAFLGSNLLIGRLPRAYFGRQTFKLGVTVMDTLFIAASLYVAQQLSVELLLLCLGVLVLAIAGLSLGAIAGVTLAMTAVSFAVGWFTGAGTLFHSSVLLRAPFLLAAALVYASLVESNRGRRAPAQPQTPEELIDSLAMQLGDQQEAIRRYGTAMAEGAEHTARAALEDVILLNRQMAARVARFHPEQAAQRAA